MASNSPPSDRTGTALSEAVRAALARASTEPLAELRSRRSGAGHDRPITFLTDEAFNARSGIRTPATAIGGPIRDFDRARAERGRS